jgi:hypothetical protein
MSEAQYQAEIMDELKQQEYNTNFGIGGSSVNLHSRRNSSTDGEVWQMGQIPLYERQTKGC